MDDNLNGSGLGVLQRPDSFGRFGKFGGKYVPETLMHALTELEAAFKALANDHDFQVLICTYIYNLCLVIICFIIAPAVICLDFKFYVEIYFI